MRKTNESPEVQLASPVTQARNLDFPSEMNALCPIPYRDDIGIPDMYILPI